MRREENSEILLSFSLFPKCPWTTPVLGNYMFYFSIYIKNWSLFLIICIIWAIIWTMHPFISLAGINMGIWENNKILGAFREIKRSQGIILFYFTQTTLIKSSMSGWSWPSPARIMADILGYKLDWWASIRPSKISGRAGSVTTTMLSSVSFKILMWARASDNCCIAATKWLDSFEFAIAPWVPNKISAPRAEIISSTWEYSKEKRKIGVHC